MNDLERLNRSARLLALGLVAALLGSLLTGCSDDVAPAPADAAAHSPADQLVPDGATANGTSNDGAAPDNALPDSALPDASSPDTTPGGEAGAVGVVTGKVGVSSKVVCTATPATDCQGTLYIGVVDKPAAPPGSTLLAAVTIAVADLSAGKQVAFSFPALPAGQQLYLSAMLAESGTLPTPPLLVSGDLVVAPVAFSVKSSGATQQGLQLDARWK